MQKRIAVVSSIILVLFVFTSICLAAATVSGSGKQTRGRPGHNAELEGRLFTLPSAGTITSVDSQGADGFWIEDERGVMIVNFNSVNEARGYVLRAGSYRVLPNLKNGFDSCWIHVTFTCP
ncbi:MAG: hypothetical protein N2491_09500 [Negativicutes bacterium]|nr:hypothetical protein [Negativicutes bacterium]